MPSRDVKFARNAEGLHLAREALNALHKEWKEQQHALFDLYASSELNHFQLRARKQAVDETRAKITFIEKELPRIEKAVRDALANHNSDHLPF
jgi:hypothetical protein